MRRRDFIALIAGAAATWPLAANGQQPVPVIGFLGAGSPEAWASRIKPFIQALKAAGLNERENVRIEYRWAEDRYERLSTLATELVHTPVAVIIAAGGVQTALAAKAATNVIPIVFQNGSDPVRVGLVASLAKPGGNLTGVTNVTVETVSKRMELIRDLVPTAKTIAYLTNPANPNSKTIVRDMEVASRALGRNITTVGVTKKADFDQAFSSLREQNIDALVISADPFFYSAHQELVERITKTGIPAIYPAREFVEGGGLASYGANFTDVYRLVGLYAARILRGEKPSDLPVMQSTKFELVVNNKTAKQLGLEVPLSLLMRIDSVIE